MLVTAAADHPLLHSQSTPLELQHSAFVTSLVYQATTVIGVRGLETGYAKDVGGVLSIRKGAGQATGLVEEKELLYFISPNGGATVWDRGV